MTATRSDDANTLEDIWDYISEDQWPLLVKCIVNDEVNHMKSFSSRVSWPSFLRSYDAGRRKRHCPMRFRTYESELRVNKYLARHPFTTNPFLMAVMFNAKRCCLLMQQTADSLDLSGIIEYGFNAYHVLFSGLTMLKTDRLNPGKRNMTQATDYLRFFLRDFFTREQVAKMAAQRNCFQMTPLDWGIYCGYVGWVDILMYRSHLGVLSCEVSGLMEHVQLDFSFTVSSEPDRMLTAMPIMADYFGESKVEELKKAKVFRKPLIVGPWIDAFYKRHRFTLAVLIGEKVLNLILTVATLNSNFRQYVISACSDPKASLPGIVYVLCSCLACQLFTLTMVIMGKCRKERYRRSMGYPAGPRQMDWDGLAWLMPTLLLIPTLILLIGLLTAPQVMCSSTKGSETYRPVVGCLLLILTINLLLSILPPSRLMPIVSKFFTSFYRSLAMFANFLIVYLLMLLIFSRLFDISSRADGAVVAGNATKSGNSSNFFYAFYSSFLVTLNVFDTNNFQPNADRADLLLTHVAFILLMPVMFINFVIGVLSSVVGSTMEHDVECRYLMKLCFAEFSECSFFWLYRAWERLTGRKASLVISLCRPLNRGSRSIVTEKRHL